MGVLHTAHLRVRAEVVEQFKDRLLRHARISLTQEDMKEWVIERAWWYWNALDAGG